jgi:hypothetical protein
MGEIGRQGLRQHEERGSGKEVRERKKKRTYAGTSYPQAKFGTINRNEQDRIPPLYQEE